MHTFINLDLEVDLQSRTIRHVAQNRTVLIDGCCDHACETRGRSRLHIDWNDLWSRCLEKESGAITRQPTIEELDQIVDRLTADYVALGKPLLDDKAMTKKTWTMSLSKRINGSQDVWVRLMERVDDV